MSLLSELCDMHTYARPMGSATEQVFIARYIARLPGAYIDVHRNWHVVTDPDSRILWSAHTDTVHHRDGRYTVSHHNGRLALSKRARGAGVSCLGADDTAGVFVLRRMILAGIAGHYVFHYGEERGGLGSSALAAEAPDWLSRIDYAIALDRKGHTDAITHQSWGRTASDAFAAALGTLIGHYRPSDAGIYTDTAEYAALIPECTNLSVGYEHAHSACEYLDTTHVLYLLQRLCAIDVSSLPPSRNPADLDDDRYESWHQWDSLPRTSSSGTLLLFTPDDLDALTPAILAELSTCELDDLQRDAYDLCHDTAVDLIDAELAIRDHATESAYLDPTYGDVQRALDAALREFK